MQTKRRTFLKSAGVAGLSLVATALSVNRASADPDPAPGEKSTTTVAQSPDPEIYSFTFGGTEAHVIHDGSIGLPSIQPAFAPEAKKSEVDELQRRYFLPTDKLSLSMNVLVLKISNGIALFDSGAGLAFAPVGGRLVRGLAMLGIKPADVKTIFVTHAHPDHVGGLVDGANKLIFSSAKIYVANREAGFWLNNTADLSGMRMPAEVTAKMRSAIQNYLKVMKPGLDLEEAGKLTPEVELVDTPGHTPGHSAFRVKMGDDELLVIGDAVHVFSLQFPRPEWTMMYDVNPALAVTTRKKLFKDAAANRTLIMGYHMPFPGLGHVRADGEGYEWVPKPWVS